LPTSHALWWSGIKESIWVGQFNKSGYYMDFLLLQRMLYNYLIYTHVVIFYISSKNFSTNISIFFCFWTTNIIKQPDLCSRQTETDETEPRRKALIRKIMQLPPPLDLRSTERNYKKTQNQTWSKELTPDLESKVIGPPNFRTKSNGHPSPSVHQRNIRSRQTRLQLNTDSRSRSKSNRPIGKQHTKSMTNNLICGGANNKQIKRKRFNSTGLAASKQRKHLKTPKNTNKS